MISTTPDRHSSRLARRSLIVGSCAVGLGAVLAACSSGNDSSPDSAATSSSAATAQAATAPQSTSQAPTAVPELDELTALAASFTQSSYEDTDTGLSLPFNVFLPEGYDENASYPLVHYIADSSLVGSDVTAPLSQYGALIWAHDVTQSVTPAIVVVPCYPEIVLDDHSGYTTTDWVGVTERFVPWLQEQYAVDPARVYGTGQSMGAMIHLLLAATQPTLFTACLFVDGQWDVSALGGLAQASWAYHVAGGDDRALTGQDEVRSMLDDAGAAYAQAAEEWDATASAEELEAAVAELVAQGRPRLLSSFVAGTVLEANPAASMEHMASFEPAYKLTGLRTWMLSQGA
ncbi:esterase [Actinomyces sp. Z5]|uniref:carboxylesterase family protein n=1 Tax=Actinomyces sp. Z5 TaxID=2250216 RepID=UPI000DCEA648|nr:alpha/beta hydrolase-fold protein [Actinomyces sp. Z5]RAX24700.1 esterase [Actinomyces sp. Z5]